MRCWLIFPDMMYAPRFVVYRRGDVPQRVTELDKSGMIILLHCRKDMLERVINIVTCWNTSFPVSITVFLCAFIRGHRVMMKGFRAEKVVTDYPRTIIPLATTWELNSLVCRLVR